MAAILPFEPPLYQAAGVRAEFVGHPLVDRLARAPDRDEARRRLGLEADAPWIALLPASRRNELAHHLTLYLETARRVHALDPRVGFLLPVAASLDRDEVEARVRAARLPSLLRLRVLGAQSLESLAACDAVLAKPGTGTLEAALLGRPLVVAARTHPLTAFLLRRLVGVDSLTMPNLVLGEAAVPELLQGEARPEAIAAALLARLQGPERERQLEAFRGLHELLGGGAAQRAAGIAEAMIDARRGAASGPGGA